MLKPRQIISLAIDWGIQQEPKAIEAYKKHQNDIGHSGLTVCPVGFIVSLTYPFLGASPDGGAHDPSSTQYPFGFVEVKYPYNHRDDTPFEACSDPSFCCELQHSSSGHTSVVLKRSHPYYCQIQGQLAVGNRPWCDFVVYTRKRLIFDCEFWNTKLCPRLIEFYDDCIAPEIVSPVNIFGMPLRDLRKVYSVFFSVLYSLLIKIIFHIYDYFKVCY